MTEQALIRQIISRNEIAFEKLYRIYHDKLYRFLFRLYGSSSISVIPSIINEVMYVVWNKADTYSHECRVSTWIFGIAVNVSRKAHATEWRHRGAHEELPEDYEAEDSGGWVVQHELRDWLEKGMSILSADQKAVVELAYYEGLHYREIAQILDCPENTVKTRMYHARCKLADALRQSSNTDLS